eukprot:scaffold62736_cov36-Phaeocystis_antarctica.AAC.1
MDDWGPLDIYLSIYLSNLSVHPSIHLSIYPEYLDGLLVGCGQDVAGPHRLGAHHVLARGDDEVRLHPLGPLLVRVRARARARARVRVRVWVMVWVSTPSGRAPPRARVPRPARRLRRPCRTSSSR